MNTELMEQLKLAVDAEYVSSSGFLMQLQSVDKDDILGDVLGITQLEKDYMNYLENR
jgi:hypothetical protein